MLKKFVEKYGDSGRRMLLSVKYRLSNCPLTYLMIRDLVQDSDNWEITQPPTLTSQRFYFSDIRNGMTFHSFNNSRGLRGDSFSYRDYSNKAEYSKFEPERIKLYYNNQFEMFNANERTIVAKVLHTHAEMLKNYEEVKRQQKLMRSSDKLRGLY